MDATTDPFEIQNIPPLPLVAPKKGDRRLDRILIDVAAEA